MLIKARGVAGDEALAAEFSGDDPAVSLSPVDQRNVMREVAAMKDRIENEVVRAGELET